MEKKTDSRQERMQQDIANGLYDLKAFEDSQKVVKLIKSYDKELVIESKTKTTQTQQSVEIERSPYTQENSQQQKNENTTQESKQEPEEELEL